MRTTYAALVLAAIAVGQAVAKPLHHAHFHEKRHGEKLEVET